MSFSKNLQAYSVSLVELFEKAMLCPEPFIIPCGSKKEAKYIQMRFCAVKYALAHSPKHPLHNSPEVLTKQVIIDNSNNVIVQDAQDSKEAQYFDSIVDKILEVNKEALSAIPNQTRAIVGTEEEREQTASLTTKKMLKHQEKISPKIPSNNDIFIPPEID